MFDDFDPGYSLFGNLSEEVMDSIIMIQEQFENTGTVPQIISDEELFN